MEKSCGLALTRDRLVTASALALLAVFLLFHLSAYNTPSDDAFISFRYSVNLAAGHGPVYNFGERVEGYTNPLFVLIGAAMAKMGIELPVGMVWLCIFSAVVLLPVTYGLGRVVAGGAATLWPLLVAALFVAANPNVAFWCTGALEAVPLALLVSLSLWRYLLEWQNRSRPHISGVMFALCYLMRPDGAIFFVAAMIHHAVFPRLPRTGVPCGSGFAPRCRWRCLSSPSSPPMCSGADSTTVTGCRTRSTPRPGETLTT